MAHARNDQRCRAPPARHHPSSTALGRGCPRAPPRCDDPWLRPRRRGALTWRCAHHHRKPAQTPGIHCRCEGTTWRAPRPIPTPRGSRRAAPPPTVDAQALSTRSSR
eukprot:4007407-Pleurochrysis_carterae.AAC.1